MYPMILLIAFGLIGEAPNTKGEATIIRGGVPSVWGGVPCSSVEWTQVSSDKTQIALIVNGKQVGNYHTDLNEYHPYDPVTDTFKGGENTPPHPLPENFQPRKPEIMNFGVDRSHIGKERYVINGLNATEAEALQALADKSLPNDKHLLRLTIIGPADLRKKVRSDLENNPLLTCFSDKYLIQDYDPSNWAVKAGFYTEGSPTIYLQSPTGKVLHRQDDYEDGAAGLATALRKADPNYTPAQDIDRRKTIALPVFSEYIPALLLFLLAVVLFLTPSNKQGN
jgi:hypothetical protein